jgi:hypothetical protein
MQVYRLAFQLCKPYDLPMTQAAVLTGDLIGSTEAGPEAVDRAIQLLSDAANDFAAIGKISQPLKFTRHRGDGWQVALHAAYLSLRLTTYLLARLRASNLRLNTRIGIGIGSIDAWGTSDLGNAHGTAFTYSGRALTSLGSSGGLALLPAEGPAQIWLIAGLETLIYLSDRWSVEQAQAMAVSVTRGRFEEDFKLEDYPPLMELARTLNISRQALSSRLAVAGEKPIMAAIRAAEATL